MATCQTLQEGDLVHSSNVNAHAPPTPDIAPPCTQPVLAMPLPSCKLTSLVLWRHLASMSYLSSSTTATLVCRSRHRSWGSKVHQAGQKRGQRSHRDPSFPFLPPRPVPLQDLPSGKELIHPFPLRFQAADSSLRKPFVLLSECNCFLKKVFLQ